MKIAISGPQCTGKSTLIKSFIERYPMYKTPEVTYREIIKDKKLKINKEGSKENQRIILDAMIEEVQQTADESNIIFDRSVIDPIAYSLWLYGKEKGKVDDDFILEQRLLVNQAVKYYDVIFLLPVRQEIKLTEAQLRDTDPEYQSEMDEIFRAIVGSYEKQLGIYFPLRDCPAVITLEGPPDLRLDQIGMYLQPNGQAFDEKTPSLICAPDGSPIY